MGAVDRNQSKHVLEAIGWRHVAVRRHNFGGDSHGRGCQAYSLLRTFRRAGNDGSSFAKPRDMMLGRQDGRHAKPGAARPTVECRQQRFARSDREESYQRENLSMKGVITAQFGLGPTVSSNSVRRKDQHVHGLITAKPRLRWRYRSGLATGSARIGPG